MIFITRVKSWYKKTASRKWCLDFAVGFGSFTLGAYGVYYIKGWIADLTEQGIEPNPGWWPGNVVLNLEDSPLYYDDPDQKIENLNQLNYLPGNPSGLFITSSVQSGDDNVYLGEHKEEKADFKETLNMLFVFEDNQYYLDSVIKS